MCMDIVEIGVWPGARDNLLSLTMKWTEPILIADQRISQKKKE